MKKLVLTISIGDRPWFEYTNRSIRYYAERIGADYREIREYEIPDRYDFRVGRNNNKSYLVKILAIQDALKEYDRIIFLDDTCTVAKDCPDLFNVVPYNFFGAHNEGILDWTMSATQMISSYEQSNIHGLINKQTYFNSGVMVLSRAHATLFEDVTIIKLGKNGHFTGGYVDQGYLNYAVKVFDTPYFALPCEFNKMILNHPEWNGKKINYQTYSPEETSLAILSKKLYHVNENTVQPGKINHAFIYHTTSAYEHDVRLELIKKLHSLVVI